jgi:hypothetical protein
MDVYKLPGSSYEEFIKIIRAYTPGKASQQMSLDQVAQAAGMDKTVISRSNGFLVQCRIVSEGVQKAATELGMQLGRAYSLGLNNEILRMWREIIENDEFLTRMLSAIRIRNTMERNAFINHIIYSSGAPAGSSSKTGAATIVELFKVAGLLTEQDGQITASLDAVDVDNVEQTQNDVTRVITHEIQAIQGENSRPTVNININISVTLDEFEVLQQKLQELLSSLKG